MDTQWQAPLIAGLFIARGIDTFKKKIHFCPYIALITSYNYNQCCLILLNLPFFFQ